MDYNGTFVMYMTRGCAPDMQRFFDAVRAENTGCTYEGVIVDLLGDTVTVQDGRCVDSCNTVQCYTKNGDSFSPPRYAINRIEDSSGQVIFNT
jgi:hypothetical protein